MLTDLALPAGRAPHLALMNSLMLVATWYTPPKHPLRRVTPPAEYFLSQTHKHLVQSLENVDSLISHIAASAFLALYYFTNGRTLELHYQTSSTARLAIACGLHQIDEDAMNQVIDPFSTDPRRSWGILGLPASEAELKQRIRVFWLVGPSSNFSQTIFRN